MSGARSAIDTLTAEDTALLDSMRDETEAPETQEATTEPDAPREAPEEQVEQDAELAAEKPKQKLVPHQQFHAERERRRAAEAKAIEAEKARAVAEGVVAERLKLLSEAAQAAVEQANPAPVAEPPIEIPDINADPVGHFRAALEQERRTQAALQRRLDEQQAMLQGFSESQRQQQLHQDLVRFGQSQEREFMAREPAYADAIKFLLDQRREELSATGIIDPRQQDQIITADTTGILQKARQDGANFAERVFTIAQKRGFTKQPAKPLVPPIDPGDDIPDAAARAERGRANATTIANVGAATPTRLTPERIANMTDQQFAAHLDKISKDPGALRDLMGH